MQHSAKVVNATTNPDPDKMNMQESLSAVTKVGAAIRSDDDEDITKRKEELLREAKDLLIINA